MTNIQRLMASVEATYEILDNEDLEGHLDFEAAFLLASKLEDLITDAKESAEQAAEDEEVEDEDEDLDDEA